ncbi:tetratricopeptide repeat protein [Kitasatospora sp. NPDC049258]|uniref:tetratricopeptide repeat protein n=1 Tax=Kitasatospora sp. NPDC049258 TaxID=3155394 RepID=UPI003412FEAE
MANDHSLAVGHADFVAHYAAPRAPVPWPHQIGVIPRQAQCFQHRHAVEQLQAAIDAEAPAVLCQVLVGTGGVGKTQLAAHHARRAWAAGRLDLLVWITATTRESITDAYAQAAVEVLGADPADRRRAVQALLAWLEHKPSAAPCRWLVVLDDIADLADLRGLWPPDNPHGRTLATTRRRDAALTGNDRHVAQIGFFTPDEAAAYLTSSLAAHHRHDHPEQIRALAADLGNLPLALSQAAAYLIDADLDCATYRQLLADRARTLPDLLPDPSGLPDDQVTTVAAAWSLSLERADRLRPYGLARPMLELASMLDPNGIPAPVLTGPPALAYLTGSLIRAGREQPEVTAEQAVASLRALHRLSLVEHNPAASPQAVRVHQLIQRAVRDTLAPDRYDRLVRAAADALIAAWPDIERDTALARSLRANSDAITSHTGDALWRSDAHLLLLRAGRSLGEAGQVTAAAAYLHNLADAAHRHLGPDHPHTLAARHELARWQGEAGDAAGAAAAYTELLVDQERVLGPDDPDVLDTRHNLSYWQGRAGEAARAVAGFAELLADRQRVLGTDDPAALAARHELARWQGEAGDAPGAVAGFAELLAIQERVLGPDDPDVLNTRHSLAWWRGEAGDAAGAVAGFAELLADRQRVQGPDHPHTLTTRHDLARWQGEAGDAAGAATALTELLADELRLLGPDHPRTLTTRHDLARWQGEANGPRRSGR